MTRDDIIRMAKEAGVTEWHRMDNPNSEAVLQAFAALVAAAEREACAKVCEDIPLPKDGIALTHLPTIEACAAAIRARGEK